ncbi:MAG: M48 family metallopeptidase [Thermoleophilaceae bacterium]
MSASEVTIRRSARARRVRIQVSAAAGVEVVVPDGLALGEVEPFVASKRGWIERTLRRMRAAEAERPPPELRDGGGIPYLGETLALGVSVQPRRARPHVARDGQTLHVAVGESGPGPLRDALERWYRRRARAEVMPRLDDAVARAGSSYTRLQIRGQRTRWASCSATATMSFNWRLLLAPAEVLDYVVEHEVAHLEVHDHSQRFWSLLADRCPAYREHEAWLRRYGQSLRL